MPAENQFRHRRVSDYFNLATALKPELEKIDGFIDNKCFESQRRKGSFGVETAPVIRKEVITGCMSSIGCKM